MGKVTLKDKNRVESKSHDMDKKLIYETPEVELFYVHCEEGILQSSVTVNNPWENAEEEEI